MILHDEHVRDRSRWHPGDPRTVMTQYRRHILTRKRQWGTARGLVHYRGFIDSYLRAKRLTGRK